MQSLIIIRLYTNKISLKFTLLKQHIKNDRIVLKVLKFSNMFRLIFDHPQGYIFFILILCFRASQYKSNETPT